MRKLLVVVCALALAGGCVTPAWIKKLPALIDLLPATTNSVPAVSNAVPVYAGPVELGAWGGRPAIALDALGGAHIVCDGAGGDLMAFWDLAGGKVSGSGIIDAKTFNPQTAQFFNPSTVILPDGTQLVTAWWFAFEVEAGCKPYVLWRKPGAAKWTALLCDPSPVDWEPAKVCADGAGAVYFGFNNDYYKLAMQNGALALGDHGNYGSGGGGEKEARWTGPQSWQVANSGCRKTGGAKYRGPGGAVLWGAYERYPAMGNDDTGHCGVSGDLAAAGVAYMAASWDDGLVYNVYNKGLIFKADALPVLDKGGWSGIVKYPLSMAARPGGGAYLLWTNGNGLFLGLLHADGKAESRKLCAGAIGALAVSADGTLHIAYNLVGKLMYRQERP